MFMLTSNGSPNPVSDDGVLFQACCFPMAGLSRPDPRISDALRT